MGLVDRALDPEASRRVFVGLGWGGAGERRDWSLADLSLSLFSLSLSLSLAFVNRMVLALVQDWASSAAVPLMGGPRWGPP